MSIVDYLNENYTSFLHNSTVSTVFALLSLAVVLHYFFNGQNGSNLPPGPTGLPIFGYYLSLGDNPMKKLSEVAKKYGNVFSIYIGSKRVVVLNNWEAMKEALGKDSALDRPPATFGEVPYNFGIAGSNGEEWVHTRRLTSRVVKDIGLNSAAFEDVLHDKAQDLVCRISAKEEKPIEVRSFFAVTFANNVMSLVLGEHLDVGHPVSKEIAKAVDAIMEFSPALGMMNFSPILYKLLQFLGLEKEFLLPEKVTELVKIISEKVDKTVQDPHKGIEDSFIAHFHKEIQNPGKEKKNYITVDSLKGNAIALLSGGSETTRTTIIWLLIAMANHPDKQRKVHEELDSVIGKDGSIGWGDRFKVPYAFAALLEAMRWGNLTPFAIRMATEDMKVQDYNIPKGTFITFNNFAIHNDTRYWKNPEQFLPERFLLEDGKKVNTSPESFNPFSYGKRNCPGKLIGQMTGLIYFTTIMQKFQVLPKDGKKVKYGTLLGLTYQATDVELKFIPR